MNTRRGDQLRYDQLTLNREGEEKITCMDDLIKEEISVKLIRCIVENHLLEQYITVSENCGINILCRIWDSCCRGQIQRDECAELFSIFLVRLYHKTGNIFRRACCEWDPSDTFLFDFLSPRVIPGSIVTRGLQSVYSRRDTSPHDMERVRHYLDLCFFLVDRNYVVEPRMVCRVLFLRDQIPGIVEMFRHRVATTSEEYRDIVRRQLKFYLGVESPLGSQGIDHRPIDYYHLLTDLSPKCTDHTSAKNSLIDAYEYIYGEIDLAPFPNPKYEEHVRQIFELICIPESSLTFPQRFHLFSPWNREPILTMMIVRHIEGNLVHIIPIELLFLIFEHLE